MYLEADLSNLGGFEQKEYRIGEICTIEKGKSPIKKTAPGAYPLVVTAEERATSAEYQFDGEAVCIPLVSSTGHGHASLKRIHYQKGKFAVGNILCAVYSNDESILLTKYLYIYLSHYKDELLVPLMKGTTNVSLNVKDISNQFIYIPDTDVQMEIVEKYELFVLAKLKLEEIEGSISEFNKAYWREIFTT